MTDEIKEALAESAWRARLMFDERKDDGEWHEQNWATQTGWREIASIMLERLDSLGFALLKKDSQ